MTQTTINPIPERSPETAPQTERAIPRRALLIFLRETILIGLFASLAFWLANSALTGHLETGSTMEPAFIAPQRILINKLAYRFGSPQRGDVVMVQSIEPPIYLVNRIIGLPGDEVVITQGQVAINGQAIHEPYANDLMAQAMDIDGDGEDDGEGRWVIPADHYFLLGDNRAYPTGSTSVGPVATTTITGKAMLTLWPPSDWGLVPHHRDFGLASNE